MSNPVSIEHRIVGQIGTLLADLDKPDADITKICARITVLEALLKLFRTLGKGAEEPGNVRGTTVQKYSRTFAANAARGRKSLPRRRGAPSPAIRADRRHGSDPEYDA